MTPKEKAIEFIGKFREYTPVREAKQCALIAVDVALNFMFLSENENSFWINYYNKVKQEIDKL